MRIHRLISQKAVIFIAYTNPCYSLRKLASSSKKLSKQIHGILSFGSCFQSIIESWSHECVDVCRPTRSRLLILVAVSPFIRRPSALPDNPYVHSHAVERVKPNILSYWSWKRVGDGGKLPSIQALRPLPGPMCTPNLLGPFKLPCSQC
jgi:hypothetical protein